MKTLQRYHVELETFGGGTRLVAANDGQYYLADSIDSFLERQKVCIDQLNDNKRDHELFVARLHRLMKADLFDDAYDEVKSEYASIHGPRD